jgi:DNA-binding transcriptional ArsR family regulator
MFDHLRTVRCNSNCTTGVELLANSFILGTVMDDVIEPAPADFQLTRILAALADPQRLATVRYVASHGESWCTQVMQEAGLAMSKSTFSHHLRILRESGVLTKRIAGAKGYTQLRKADLDQRFPGLMDAILDASPPPIRPDLTTRADAPAG